MLNYAVQGDSDESCTADVLAFVNMETLPERMKDRESIVMEFGSKHHDWCRFRFFAMDRKEGDALVNVIFAVQDINDERSEAQDLTERLEKAEAASTAGNTFLSMASEDLQAPVREVIELNEMILRESGEETVRTYAEDIRSTADRMLALIRGLAQRAETAAAEGKPVSLRYSPSRAAEEALRMVRPAAEKKQIRLETAIDGKIPEELIGDEEKLKEIMASLLANSIRHSADGCIRLSMFGKTEGEKVHLLVSVRALPENRAPSGEQPEGKPVRAENDLDLEVARELLNGMGSELKSVLSADAWKDIYFEIDQQVAEDNGK